MRWACPLPAGGRPAFAELDLAGRIFGYMTFQFCAPQRLKRPAASVQCLNFGKVGMFAADVAPFDSVGGNSSVVGHKRSGPYFSKTAC